ncbi:hypothetical protein DB347_04785 [Opitutaceae bacterium EW11]|nr:hypothetical protein DB347_04785 [Opitutaceae bacterium EW11]
MPLSRTKPPPTPHETLRRVIGLARIDGRIVLWLSGCFALLSAGAHDATGAIAGCAAAGAGAMEVHGATLLVHGSQRGVDWLVRAQLVLLATILIYVAFRITQFDPQMIESRITPEIEQRIRDVPLTREQFVEMCRILSYVVYSVVGFVSLIYQGGMARYYAKRRQTIELALEAE